MSRGNNRGDIFLADEDRLMFLALLREGVRRFRWILHEFVLMTNHYHLVLETPERTLSRGMKWVNQNYAQWFNRRHDRVGHLFQGRFKSILVEKETHLLELLRYVALNPVRAGMVERPEEYRWSSYRVKAGYETPPEWLAPEWTLAHFGPDLPVQQREYRRFVTEGAVIEREPFDQLVAQLFLGTEAWIERMRTEIEEKPRSNDHPAAQRYAGRPRAHKIVETVAEVFRQPSDQIRNGRGGVERMVAAWLACYEGMERLGAIATSLRLKSTSRVSMLIRECDEQLDRDKTLRAAIDRCVERLRGGVLPASVMRRQIDPELTIHL
jgi:REP element-mobilizing transposase RayT